MSKQLSASRSMACGSKLTLLLVSRCGALSLGVSLALGWSDLEAWLPLTMSRMGLRQDWASPTCLRVVPG